MDIRKYLESGPSTEKCTTESHIANSGSSECDSEITEPENNDIESNEQEPSQPTPSKKQCTASDFVIRRAKRRPKS